MTAAGSRGPGRPRTQELEDRVIDSTVALLLEADQKPVTMAEIVRRSGVSRAAIYRRWASREELIGAALDSVRSDPVMPDSGDLVTDLSAGYRLPQDRPQHFDRLVRIRLQLALADPAIMRSYWERHVSRRRVPAQLAFRRAIDRGEIRSDSDIEAAIDLIAGAAYYQAMVRGERLEGETLRRYRTAIGIVVAGLRP